MRKNPAPFICRKSAALRGFPLSVLEDVQPTRFSGQPVQQIITVNKINVNRTSPAAPLLSEY